MKTEVAAIVLAATIPHQYHQCMRAYILCCNIDIPRFTQHKLILRVVSSLCTRLLAESSREFIYFTSFSLFTTPQHDEPFKATFPVSQRYSVERETYVVYWILAFERVQLTVLERGKWGIKKIFTQIERNLCELLFHRRIVFQLTTNRELGHEEQREKKNPDDKKLCSTSCQEKWFCVVFTLHNT